MFAELPAEHVPGPPPLAPGVRHDAWLLTDKRKSSAHFSLMIQRTFYLLDCKSKIYKLMVTSGWKLNEKQKSKCEYDTFTPWELNIEFNILAREGSIRR